MKIKEGYRKSASVALLLVYIFITTPVQLWHRHQPVHSSFNNHQTNEVSLTNGISLTDHCAVCLHNYSSYIITNTLISFAPVSFYNTLQVFYQSAIPITPNRFTGSRGPPSIL